MPHWSSFVAKAVVHPEPPTPSRPSPYSPYRQPETQVVATPAPRAGLYSMAGQCRGAKARSPQPPQGSSQGHVVCAVFPVHG